MNTPDPFALGGDEDEPATAEQLAAIEFEPLPPEAAAAMDRARSSCCAVGRRAVRFNKAQPRYWALASSRRSARSSSASAALAACRPVTSASRSRTDSS